MSVLFLKSVALDSIIHRIRKPPPGNFPEAVFLTFAAMCGGCRYPRVRTSGTQRHSSLQSADIEMLYLLFTSDEA